MKNVKRTKDWKIDIYNVDHMDTLTRRTGATKREVKAAIKQLGPSAAAVVEFFRAQREAKKRKENEWFGRAETK
jgi:hypothetical protein